ncbi:Flp pilus assembly protein CpaB [Nocardioides sp. GCM10027113]|uniref:Flp pilus assembly protein CpaB n=1 Tax=unclassified Nocardioides TaxID=2615069 RepID=UPI0036135B2D
MNRRRALLIAAVLVAVMGTTLVFLYVQKADERAQQQYDTVEVLQAVAPIEPGESIDEAARAGKLAMQPVAQADVLPNHQTSIDPLRGLVATTRIYPGEQIIADKFGGEAQADSPLQIPKGMMAISVNLTDPARVAGFVNPGSEVAVFLNGTAQDGQPFTRMLLPRVTVLGVGSTTPTTTTTTTEDGEQTVEELPRTLLTLAVEQKDAQKVLFGTSNGELAFGLLTADSTVKPDSGVTAGELFQ